MSKVKKIFEKAGKLFEIFVDSVDALKADEIKQSITDRLASFDFDGVEVTDVEVLFEGGILVVFEDFEGDEMVVLFDYDEEDNARAIIVDDEQDWDDFNDMGEYLEVDLSPLFPGFVETPFGRYVNLVELGWLNRSSAIALLSVGEIDTNIEGGDTEDDDEDNRVEELYKVVVRGGKKVRLPLVRKRRRKALTPKQKAGIKKGVLKRKRTASQSQRKRKLSLKKRKSLGIEKQKTPVGYKVSR
jgi:hypothetical protein